MYDRSAQASGRQGSGARRAPRTDPARRQERTRLVQLLLCLALFLVVFVGKGVFPGRLVQLRDDLLTMISRDTDFRGAFSRLGEALTGEGTVLDDLGSFCVEAFGGTQTQEQEEDAPGITPQLTGLLNQESQFLSRNQDDEALASHFLNEAGQQVALELSALRAAAQPQVQLQQQPQTDAVPAAGTLLVKSDYSGQALPGNYTMDQLSLGELDTVTPVLGRITSVYGYRDHPISGVYQFHGGVDISGNKGDPIAAFAAGTVEYVGEDDSYGLYLQLDHSNGVKSFYAHCSAVCVKKGQTVALGEKIAEVGSSGSATGPHLHLELKYNKMHLNPIYYIQYLSDQ